MVDHKDFLFDKFWWDSYLLRCCPLILLIPLFLEGVGFPLRVEGVAARRLFTVHRPQTPAHWHDRRWKGIYLKSPTSLYLLKFSFLITSLDLLFCMSFILLSLKILDSFPNFNLPLLQALSQIREENQRLATQMEELARLAKMDHALQQPDNVVSMTMTTSPPFT